MLAEARAKGTVAPVRGHAERLPFPDGSFDRILVVDALHHFCDQREAIGDLLRVLAPGGRLLVAEPRGHVSEQDLEGTIGAAERAGLSVVDRPDVKRSRAVLMEKPR